MSKKIFLASDDSQFRETIRPILENFGHQVIFEAENYSSAETLIPEAVSAGVEVLITDQRMPNYGDGIKLAFSLNEKNPALMVVAASIQWHYNGEGNWLDPSFDTNNLSLIKAFDIHGRSKTKGPDIFINPDDPESFQNLPAAIESWTFSPEIENTVRQLKENGLIPKTSKET